MLLDACARLRGWASRFRGESEASVPANALAVGPTTALAKPWAHVSIQALFPWFQKKQIVVATVSPGVVLGPSSLPRHPPGIVDAGCGRISWQTAEPLSADAFPLQTAPRCIVLGTIHSIRVVGEAPNLVEEPVLNLKGRSNE